MEQKFTLTGIWNRMRNWIEFLLEKNYVDVVVKKPKTKILSISNQNLNPNHYHDVQLTIIILNKNLKIYACYNNLGYSGDYKTLFVFYYRDDLKQYVVHYHLEKGIHQVVQYNDIEHILIDLSIWFIKREGPLDIDNWFKNLDKPLDINNRISWLRKLKDYKKMYEFEINIGDEYFKIYIDYIVDVIRDKNNNIKSITYPIVVSFNSEEEDDSNQKIITSFYKTKTKNFKTLYDLENWISEINVFNPISNNED